MRTSYQSMARATAFVTFSGHLLWGAAAVPTVTVSRLDALSNVDEGMAFLGHSIVCQQNPENTTNGNMDSGFQSQNRGETSAAHSSSERVFLDLSMCFDRKVAVTAVDFCLIEPAVLHAGRLRWHVLHAIPSLSESPTQWFQVADALPAAPMYSSRLGPSAVDAFPGPGAYRLALDPPLQLGYSACIGWSIASAYREPFGFHEVAAQDLNDVAVAWAESTDGLHDAVELFVKRGERPAPHIDWTGLIQRRYAVRLGYTNIGEKLKLESAVSAEARASAPSASIVPGGNPACWRGGYSFEQCCAASDGPDPRCWDSVFTFERCCTLTTSGKDPITGMLDRGDAPHYDLRHLIRGNAPRLGPVQDDEALLLYAFVRAIRPRTIVEFGTANCFSALNWINAIEGDPDARVFSYDIVPYPRARALEDADPRFVFIQKSQADFEPADVLWRPVEVAFFDAGHLVEYSVKAFERLLPSLSPTALVVVHDTGLHIADYGSGAPKEEEGLPFSFQRCESLPGGVRRCHRFDDCAGESNEHGLFCVGRAHRPSERQFVREVLQRWPEFRPLHVHSRRVFRHGLTLLQRGGLWDPKEAPAGVF